MAQDDILPLTSALGGHTLMRSARMDATATYNKGDVVTVAAAGDVVEASTEHDVTGAQQGLSGVAMVNPQNVANATVGDKLLATAASAGKTVSFVPFLIGDEFITSNITADDDAVLDEVPLESQIGDLCNLRTGSGLWGISVHASGAALNFVVTQVLDTDYKPVGVTGNAGVYAVFARVS